MARRLSRGELLANGGEELRRNYETFEADFLSFFPELVAFANASVRYEER
jgi:acyl carrier protein phosphodiesterase